MASGQITYGFGCNPAWCTSKQEKKQRFVAGDLADLFS